MRYQCFLLACFIFLATGFRIAQRTSLQNRLAKTVDMAKPVLMSTQRLASPITIPSRRLSLHQHLWDERVRGSPLPTDSNIHRGRLNNGLEYVILENKCPSGQLEAHLEILSGSVHEQEHQQGMAHLLEHIAFMGSPERDRLINSGARANAYTDFHHSVYFASSAPHSDGKAVNSLNLAISCLADVMKLNYLSEDLLNKERAAVLSEMSMVNNIDYRVECAILSALHKDNLIPARFPIGKEKNIKAWTLDDIRTFHQTHYRPDNAVLYIVGDIDVSTTLRQIGAEFGSLKTQMPRLPPAYLKSNMHKLNRHWPPVMHQWKRVGRDVSSSDEVDKVFGANVSASFGRSFDVTVFQNDLLHSVSIHILAKRPLYPMLYRSDLKSDILNRIAAAALSTRLSIGYKPNSLCRKIEFNHLPFPREGCEVCSLDLVTAASNWKSAVVGTLKEIKRFAVFGITPAELRRCGDYVQNEVDRRAQSLEKGLVTNEELLNDLMQNEQSGHANVNPATLRDITRDILSEITIDDVNIAAREMLSHFTFGGMTYRPKVVTRGVAVFCSPNKNEITGESFEISKEEVLNALEKGLTETLTNETFDSIYDDTDLRRLLSAEEMNHKMESLKPTWFQHGSKSFADPSSFHGKLSNGVTVISKRIQTELDRVDIRLFFSGGTAVEDAESSGSTILGSQTIQDGGSFRNISRQVVELFCLRNMLMLEVIPREDGLVIDIKVDTGKAVNNGLGGEISGLEAAMQVIHAIMTEFQWDNTTFEEAQRQVIDRLRSRDRDLESHCKERLLSELVKRDIRFCGPDIKTIECLTLKTVKEKIQQTMIASNMRVIVIGDVDKEETQSLARKYLGTIKFSKEGGVSATSAGTLIEKFPYSDQNNQIDKVHEVVVLDSEPRGVAYIAGYAPNKWGIFSDGSNLFQGHQAKDRSHWKSRALLMILEEIATRRLFSVVRDQRKLTYDANFKFQFQNDLINGSYYVVSVTSPKELVARALEAAQYALSSLLTGDNKNHNLGITDENLRVAKQSLLNKITKEKMSNHWWLEELSGPEDSLMKLLDKEDCLETEIQSAELQDIQDAANSILGEERRRYKLTGVTM